MADPMILAGKLDVRAVATLHAALSERLDSDVRLDLAQVTHIGALCLQTLIAAGIALRAGGHRLELDGLSTAVESQIHIMGASQSFITEGVA